PPPQTAPPPPASLSRPQTCRRRRRHDHQRRLAAILDGMTIGLRPVVVEHEQPDGCRQIAVRASGIDLGDQVRQCLVAADGDLFQSLPEGVFKADAGLVTGDDDRALDDWRFHCLSPVSTRCRSRLRWALSLRDCVAVRSALVRPWAKRLPAAFCSASRRLARFRAVRRLTTSPIRWLGGNRITSLRPSWPASAETIIRRYPGTGSRQPRVYQALMQGF